MESTPSPPTAPLASESNSPAPLNKIHTITYSLILLIIGIACGVLVDRMLLLTLKPLASLQTSIATQTSPTKTSQPQSDIQSIPEVKLSRLEVENDVLVGNFAFNNLIQSSELDSIIYWTDIDSACFAKTIPYTSTFAIELPHSPNYIFFMIKDVAGHTSPILTTSPYPLFQCGLIAE